MSGLPRALRCGGRRPPRGSLSDAGLVGWRGTLARYVGRLHRLHPAKREVLVYDYVDEAVTAIRRMSEKRIRGYRGRGHTVERSGGESTA